MRDAAALEITHQHGHPAVLEGPGRHHELELEERRCAAPFAGDEWCPTFPERNGSRSLDADGSGVAPDIMPVSRDVRAFEACAGSEIQMRAIVTAPARRVDRIRTAVVGDVYESHTFFRRPAGSATCGPRESFVSAPARAPRLPGCCRRAGRSAAFRGGSKASHDFPRDACRARYRARRSSHTDRRSFGRQ